MNDHWAKEHQWWQDRDYHWYQSCKCSRCAAYTEKLAREQQEHIARGELSWVSEIGTP